MPAAVVYALLGEDQRGAAEPRLLGPPGRTLRETTVIVIRPLEQTDGDLVHEVFDGLGPASRYSRYLVPKTVLTADDLRRLTAIDHQDHEALVALDAVDGAPIGIARLIRLHDDPDTAEVAIEVVDHWQGRGAGTLLTDALTSRARALGVGRLWIYMAPDNVRAAHLMHQVSPVAECLELSRDAAEYAIPLAS